MRIIEVAFVGGPNGGKSHAIPLVKESLEEFGYDVLVGLECATVLMQQGVHPEKMTGEQFQTLVLSAEMAQEEKMRNAAKASGKDTVILYDRAIPDGEVFVNRKWYVEELKKYGLNKKDILKNYHIVIDMVSVAVGLPELYNNDGCRFHSKEESAILEKKTQKVYGRHSNFVVIDNSTNFEQKVHRATIEIIERIGKAK